MTDKSLLLPERFRFKGALNAFMNSIGDGNESLISFGPFPEGYPIAQIRILLASTVAANVATITVRAVWSEKRLQNLDLGGAPTFASMNTLIFQGPGESSDRLSMVAPTTGSIDVSIPVFQLVPAETRYVLFAINGVNENSNVQVGLIPGPFSFTE